MHSFKVSVSDRGQIVIPAEIRRKFESRDFLISFEEGKIIMMPNKKDEKMKVLVEKLKQMNKLYEKSSKEKISVLDEIKKEGA